MRQLGLFNEAKLPLPPIPYTPRPYQTEALNRAFSLYNSGARGALLHVATGGGKSMIAAMIARRWLQCGENRRVLALAPERKLVQQLSEEFSRLLSMPVPIEMAEQKVEPYSIASGDARVIAASRQTLYQKERNGTVVSRLYKFDTSKYDWLLILDEVHLWRWGLQSCRHILEHFDSAKASFRIGLTATPYRADGVTLKKICPKLAISYPLFGPPGTSNAVEDGWCVPYNQQYVQVKGVEVRSIKEVAGDYDSGALDDLLRHKIKLASLLDPAFKLVGKRRTIIFCPSVEFAHQAAAYLNERHGGGQKIAEGLDGSVMDKVRSLTYQRHQQGKFQFLCVCGLCRAGYNDPGVSAIVCLRPTKSQALAEQMMGRGCRVLPNTVDGLKTADERKAAIAKSKKRDCMIVDLAGLSCLAQAVSIQDKMLEGYPDVVAQIIKKRTKGKGNVAKDVENALNKTRTELQDLIKRHERQDQYEKIMAQIGNNLETMVRFVSHRVPQGAQPKYIRSLAQNIQQEEHCKQNGGTCTLPQRKYIRSMGIDLGSYPITKETASIIISMQKRGARWYEIKKACKLPDTVQAKIVGWGLKSKMRPVPAKNELVYLWQALSNIRNRNENNNNGRRKQRTRR